MKTSALEPELAEIADKVIDLLAQNDMSTKELLAILTVPARRPVLALTKLEMNRTIGKKRGLWNQNVHFTIYCNNIVNLSLFVTPLHTRLTNWKSSKKSGPVLGLRISEHRGRGGVYGRNLDQGFRVDNDRQRGLWWEGCHGIRTERVGHQHLRAHDHTVSANAIPHYALLYLRV